MRTDSRIFREKLFMYVIFGILFGGLAFMWISHYAFPFGNKGAVGLFILLMVYSMMLSILYWGLLRHRMRVVIDSKGIHHYDRRFTLSNNSTFWLDDYRFYPWDKIKTFYFDWMPTRGWMDRYLVIEDEEKILAFILISK